MIDKEAWKTHFVDMPKTKMPFKNVYSLKKSSPSEVNITSPSQQAVNRALEMYKHTDSVTKTGNRNSVSYKMPHVKTKYKAKIADKKGMQNSSINRRPKKRTNKSLKKKKRK